MFSFFTTIRKNTKINIFLKSIIFKYHKNERENEKPYGIREKNTTSTSGKA